MKKSAADAVPPQHLKRISILGCGAIGSRIARSIVSDLNALCTLSGLYDVDSTKAVRLAKLLSNEKFVKHSLDDALTSCDIMVEAVNASDTRSMIRQALSMKKHVLTMSVGRLLNADDLFEMAGKNHCSLIIPSGAIAGIDAVKSACLVPVKKIMLTTRKPITGFRSNAYIKERGINLETISEETVIFEGSVDDAVRFFPQNINVAATLALASRAKSKITIRILTAPEYKINSHEIEVEGDFGHMVSRTENVICPDNPKTSYLAVLSAIQTLKEFCSGVRIGT